MIFYGYISENSKRYNVDILTTYFNYSIENNISIKKIFTDEKFINDELFETCHFINLIKRDEIKHSTLIINNCLDISDNLLELSNIYIKLQESNIKIGEIKY